MQSNHSAPYGNTASLPPVNPPTGKFIVELFLVPGLIVGLIVCLLLLVNWLFSGPRSPEAFLRKLDDPNVEIRWRAAADLSQVLPRDPQLASNSDFCQKLSERLDRTLRDNEPEEKAFQERLAKLDAPEAEKERRKLEPERNYIMFLTGVLGAFKVPAGVPVLGRIIEQDPVMELRELTLRRRNAVFALANLGGNLRNQAEPVTALPVDRYLIKAAQSDDPKLRELAAYAMGLWKVDTDQRKRMEEALVRLSSDDGRGMDRLEEFQGPDPSKSQEILSQPGLMVQINATLSLLRLGSDQVRASKVKEMLSEKQLDEEIQIQNPNGKREANRAKAVETVTMTLKALAEYYRHKPADSLPGVPERIRELTTSSQPAILRAAQAAAKELETTDK